MILRFSIIIPVYNIGENILRCLCSLANQTFSQFEVIIVNDGSEDNSLEIINDFFSKHQDMKKRIITQANAGAGLARNRGLDEAMGEYIVFIDSDDYIDADFLEKVYEKIIDNNADVVFIDLVREKPNGEIIRNERMSRFSNLEKKRLIRWQMTGKVPWGGVRKVVRRSIIADNHLRYAPIKVGEESFYSFRVLEEAQVISFQPKAIYHYIDTGESLTSKDTVSNSVMMFEYMTRSLVEIKKYDQYRETINALAVTTVAVTMNLLSDRSLSKELIGIGKEEIERYNVFVKDKIDTDSLDSRVRFLLPWIKLGWPLPIFMIAKLKRLTKKL